MNKNYEIIDHTADISVKVSAKSLEELLDKSSAAMMDIICDLNTIEPRHQYKISANGKSDEELIVNLLQELLYLHEVKRLLFCKFELKINEEKEIEGACWGEQIDFARHDLLNDIKAVTYSGLQVEHKNGELSVTITFDI
ncbi:MAG: archease [Candidatus Dadabacteria bacterium]|nr:archease [Candidatus Dadabacteria bacterium]NIS09940.1 archease [Candidatus Dadabacteria bacterium]NIY22558.1 archease [Candidatus Dadabacteria bacterium]